MEYATESWHGTYSSNVGMSCPCAGFRTLCDSGDSGQMLPSLCMLTCLGTSSLNSRNNHKPSSGCEMLPLSEGILPPCRIMERSEIQV